VLGQVALSLVLVMAAALLVGSFRRLSTLDPGFRPRGVLVVQASFRNAGLDEGGLAIARSDLLRRLRALPGVDAASASLLTPLGNMRWNDALVVPGYTPAAAKDAVAFFNAVSDGYFSTLGTALLAGRDFDRGDVAGSGPVAIVNEAFVKKFFHGSSPIGRPVVTDGFGGPDTALEVVGVVEDTKYRSMRDEQEPLVFVPFGQFDGITSPSMQLELRGYGPAGSLVPTVTRVLGRVNGNISLRFTPLQAQLDASLARERLLATLSGFFGGLALLLAVVGLYGTMAYSVAQRRGEIGIRIALGAARARVMRLVLGEAGRLVLAGLVLGAVGALAATRWVESFLFGLTPSDPATWAWSAATLAAVAVAACALPAWRAARMDPSAALRAE
jgi:predicted permease